jgi:RecJ-like exonuclease
LVTKECQSCHGRGTKFVVDRVVQGQDYGPHEEGHNIVCKICNGTGKEIGLQIIVRGKDKSGKTTISKLIRDTLRKNGISCHWKDEDDNKWEVNYELDKRNLEALANKKDYVVDVVVDYR